MIIGCGFKDRETAVRTLWLTNQPGSRHKRYWTIRAMRERAKFHPHFKTSPKMQEALVVFDDWLLWNKTGVSRIVSTDYEISFAKILGVFYRLNDVENFFTSCSRDSISRES